MVEAHEESSAFPRLGQESADSLQMPPRAVPSEVSPNSNSDFPAMDSSPLSVRTNRVVEPAAALDRQPPTRSSSASSTRADTSIVTKETIYGFPPTRTLPLPSERMPRTQSAPVTVKTVQIPSDAGSTGSVASVLDSIGAATLAEQKLQAAQNGPASKRLPPTDNEQTPLAGPLNPASLSDLPQQDLPPAASHAPQHLEGMNLVSQSPPLLVAVPYQPAPADSGPPADAQETQYVQQPQQTVLYQIPGVVTYPVSQDGQPIDVNSASQAPHEQPQNCASQSLQQDQILGMVGTIPIVKLQGGGVQFVKKTKGRFKFLQETPSATQSVPVVAGAPVETATTPMTVLPTISQGVVQNNPNIVPSNIAVPMQTQSVVSQLSVPMAQETFDGSNIPMVKKKGRFVVTNVRDPVSIPQTAPVSQQPPQSFHTEAAAPTPQPAPHQPNNHVPTPPQVVAQLAVPSSVQEVPVVPDVSQSVPDVHVPIQTPPVHVAVPLQPVEGMPPPPPVPAQVHVPAPVPAPPDNVAQRPRSGTVSEQAPLGAQNIPANVTTVPNEAKVKDSPAPQPNPSPAAPSTQTPSHTPSNTPSHTPLQTPTPAPQPAESIPNQARKPASFKPAPVRRPQKAPPSFATNGVYGKFGLGKISYFLDQMKSEVCEADRMVRSLQTDAKLLRDKNKELEAKNRELDRKLKEEVVFRQRAEARCMELRKKLREASGETGKPVVPPTPNEPAGPRPLNPEKGTIAADAGARTNGNKGANGASPKLNAAPRTAGPQKAVPPKSATQNPNHADGPAKPVGLPTNNTGSQPAQPASTARPPQPQPQPQAQPPPQEAALGKPPAPSPTRATTISVPRSSMEGKSKDTKPRHIRSNSTGSGFFREPEFQGSNKLASDVNAMPDAKGAPAGGNRAPEVPGAPPLQLPAAATAQRPPGASLTSSIASNYGAPGQKATLSQFDPLGPNASSNLAGDVVPVISFPTNVSLGAVPIASTTMFQGQAPQAYSATTMDQFNQAAFVTENPYMVIGMAPASLDGNSNMMSNGQQIAGGFQVQQPFMLQQPIMLQQVNGGMQQWQNQAQAPTAGAGCGPTYYQASPLQTAQQQAPMNPFDPFG